jgi:hypothetical protein
MGVVELKRPVSSRTITLLKEALERAESGETMEITLLEEAADFSMRTNWSGSDDLLKVTGHLARMQYVVQKRMSQEYD